MKKKDWFIITGIVIVLAIVSLIVWLMQGEKGSIAVQYHDEVVQTIDISKDGTYCFTGDYGQFCIEVKDHQYRAVDVECPNHDCEKVGWVKEGSVKAIVCVPNNIAVTQVDAQQ